MSLIGTSIAIQHLRRLIRTVGPSPISVLIQGETGVGKEVVARELYNQHPKGPFVVIDCAALAHNHLSFTELFGYNKGSFTGAFSSRRGLFAEANGGTVFLDEIGELPLELQPLLLRVLQEKEFRPVGGLTKCQVDFRVIAATNRNLEKEIAAGRFRQDLFFRVDGVELYIPPLRQRREDIPALARWFANEAPGNPQITPDIMDYLIWYDWPGNVRQLRTYIERMTLLCSDGQLAPSDLAFYKDVWPRAPENSARSPEAAEKGPFLLPGDGGCSRPFTLKQRERVAIREALAHAGGDRSLAASLLGISRTTLYRKLNSYA